MRGELQQLRTRSRLERAMFKRSDFSQFFTSLKGWFALQAAAAMVVVFFLLPWPWASAWKGIVMLCSAVGLH